jgi:plastocyanin
MRPITWTAVAVVAGAIALAGCGGGSSSGSSSGSGGSGGSSSGSSGSGSGSSSSGSSSSSSGGGETIKLAADPSGQLKFDKSTLKAKAGQLTIDFSNSSGIPHAVAVKGNGVQKVGSTITSGKNTLALSLKPGTYEFYCPVDGHEQAGMKGTLTVR